MKQEKFSVLALFDYNSFTGYATVSKNLLKHWRAEFGDRMNIDIVAINYFGDDYKEDANTRVISAKLKDVVKDDFGRHVFLSTLRQNDYELIFILQDLGVVVPIIKHLKNIKEEKRKNNQKQFKSIFYFPVDFALTPNLGVGLEFFDFLATYTEYGRTHAIRVCPAIKPKLSVIPHGNNLSNFRPLAEQDKIKFREEYFGANSKKFIISSVNRNQPRKDIPNTIFGFIEYKENYNKESFLYLHMNPKDPMGWNLKTILSQTPLIENVDYMFPSEEDYNKGASVEKMNNIYNASDVFLSTATGGGWELTVTEAMATKLPVIIPKHTSFEYLAGPNSERAYLLESLYPFVSTVDNIIRLQTDIYEIAETLDIVKKDLDEKNIKVQNKIDMAYKFIESLEWRDIAKKFSEKIKGLI